MDCDNCNGYCAALLNISKDILVKDDEHLQWNMLEEFLKKCIENQIEMYYDPDMFTRNHCSIHISSLLVPKLDEIRRNNMTLSTLLLDLIAIILNKDTCAQYSVQRLWDFERISPSTSDRETYRVINALRQGHTHFMKVLLNFGFLSSLSGDSPDLIEAMNEEFDDFMEDITNAYPGVDFSEARLRFMQLIKGFFRYEGKEFRIRMFLVEMAIRDIRLDLFYELHNVKCLDSSGKEIKDTRSISALKMYFTGTEDPLLSVFEVRSVLYVRFQSLNKLHLFDRYCQKLQKLMPEFPAQIEPRSLSHLVRCQIRKYLKASHPPLPSAIDNLPLPKILKSFLLGEIFDIERSNLNDSSQKYVTETELKCLLSKLSL